MKPSITGAGSLSRKLTAILLSTVMLMAGAADNSIYVDQTGSGATVTMTQDGYGNVIRGTANGDNTTNAVIYGDNNQVNISQVGNDNTLKLEIGRAHV